METDPDNAETDLGAISGLEPKRVYSEWYNVDANGNKLTFLHNDPTRLNGVPLLPFVDGSIDHINEVMAEIEKGNDASITSAMIIEYQRFRNKFLPHANEVNNQVAYADRIGFNCPFWYVYESDYDLELSPPIVPRVNGIYDATVDNMINILRGLTINHIRSDRPPSRAYESSSTLATSIRDSILSSQSFTAFSDYMKSLIKKDMISFQSRFLQCKRSVNGLLNFQKGKNATEAPCAILLSLGSFLQMLYTPLLDIYAKHVGKIMLQNDTNELCNIPGFGKVRVKDLKSLKGRKVVEMLVILFNRREESMCVNNELDDDLVNDANDDRNNSRSRKNYKKIKFEHPRAIINILKDQEGRGQLPSEQEFSKLIFTYRYKVEKGVVVALVVVKLSNKTVSLLDPYMSVEDATKTLDFIGKNLERYFNTKFDVNLYETIKTRDRMIDSFEKLKFTTNDEPVIYMFIMIYHIIYSCPIVFKGEDLNQFKDKIIYYIIKTKLYI